MAPDDKGVALEVAVHAIEAVILESSPSLRGQPFEIERRKTITVDGVHHEIDIFVTVGAAKGYESTFIFECKNWEAPVNKNEIIIFSEKIDAARAQRGYFVAKAFTKDALAQSAKDPRMTILYATEHDITSASPPEGFHITALASVKCCTTFRVMGSTGANMDPIDVQGKIAQIGGTDVLLTDYLNSWLDEVYAQRLLGFFTADLLEGIHPMTASAQRSFKPGACLIDGRDIEHVRLEAAFGVQIIRPAVISDYEVGTRGRVMRLAKVNIRDFVIDTAFVTTLDH
ncbi:MAG TPA: restriction endonuclease [Bryobacteraceae bacterium]|nr:restriction endonuclease [Bryobacteraceae bacterium]HZW91907.1 restriction endonuclease [Candidatus Eremiobacteraceae bacterium]